MRTVLLASLSLLYLGTSGVGCATVSTGRDEVVVDGEVVRAPLVGSRDYEAYLRVRMAIDSENPDFDAARADLQVLLQRHGYDPQLWTTKAELEFAAGDDGAAREALARAFALTPDYPAALELQARIDGTANASGG